MSQASNDSDHGIYRARREMLAERLRLAGGGVALVPTAPVAIRSRDSEFPFRHDSYFHYLTGFTEPEALLAIVCDASGVRSHLFCRARDPEQEVWTGWRLGPDAAPAALGVDAAAPIERLDAELPGLLADRPAVWLGFGHSAALDARVAAAFERLRERARSGVQPPAALRDLTPLLDEMRLVKDAQEIGTMKRAIAISAHAHIRAMRHARAGQREYELEAELLHEFRRHGAQSPAYGSIVASGANACVLHYERNDARMAPGSLVLIDAGCELDGYAADITRTFPVDGRFTPEQRAVYEVVLAAQAAAIDCVLPGQPFDAAHDAAVRVLAQGLVDLKLLAGSVDEVIASGAYKRFYMHRTGHWLGLDVHDAGDYREPLAATLGSPDAAAERPSRRLKPGMVVTVEPGLYLRGDDLPPGFRDIGIRIEDDVLVTVAEGEVLSEAAPKSVAAIETLMAEARA
ncbi:aminopeptidase P N-terminal domain-containing protein [Derxia lacustris]|uniref:aminopeptidase P N-terminal domain-containing protein n=1 Tax=Derxia lacustris TaxID=764842 RepID=UPI000A17179A|nr:aminopeptidase P N-terminal domain-containing protein [Derxia lacustris]